MDITPLDTPIAAMVRGWGPFRPLSGAEWRARLHKLKAHHAITAASGYSQPQGDSDELMARRRQSNPELVYPDDGTGAWHPAVITHPETGRTALYVSHFVSHFEGLDIA